MNVERSGGRFGLGGGPEGVVLLQPFTDRAVDADVVTQFLGLEPLVLQDLVALAEEVFPQIAIGQRLR